MKTLYFDPFEMYSAGLGRPDAGKSASVPDKPRQPWGHRGSTKAQLDPTEMRQFQLPALFASTGVYCSAPDFASFVSMHLRTMKGLPTQVLQSGPVNRLYTPFSDTNATAGSRLIVSRPWVQGEALMEDGRCDGFGLSCRLAPKTGNAYFAVANVDGDEGVKITNEAVILAIRYAAADSWIYKRGSVSRAILSSTQISHAAASKISSSFSLVKIHTPRSFFNVCTMALTRLAAGSYGGQSKHLLSLFQLTGDVLVRLMIIALLQDEGCCSGDLDLQC